MFFMLQLKLSTFHFPGVEVTTLSSRDREVVLSLKLIITWHMDNNQNSKIKKESS
jgi:hypothetical protein